MQCGAEHIFKNLEGGDFGFLDFYILANFRKKEKFYIGAALKFKK